MEVKMENKFSEEQKQELLKICEEGGKIRIVGMNSRGQKFETVGRIAHDDKNKPTVFDDLIFVEFGKEKDEPDRKQTKWFAPYTLNIKESTYETELIILSIEREDGTTIYSTEIQEEMEEIAKRNDAGHRHNMVAMDPVTLKLTQLIGNPVTLDDTCGILAGVDGVSQSGAPIVDLLIGPMICGTHVYAESVLYTIDQNDEQVLTAVNNEMSYNIARNENLKSMPSDEKI